MNDPCLAYSAGGSRQCDAKAQGAAALTTVARGLTELWQIPARSNGDLSMQGAQDNPWLNLCCPHCSVLAAPLAWRRQWLA
jgi:hypothetical protein